MMNRFDEPRHCEERSDEAIQSNLLQSLPLWIAARPNGARNSGDI